MAYEFKTCPYCGYDKCVADWVDIGVGNQQCGPYGCENCYAVQINPFDFDGEKLNEDEKRTGWHRGK